MHKTLGSKLILVYKRDTFALVIQSSQKRLNHNQQGTLDLKAI